MSGEVKLGEADYTVFWETLIFMSNILCQISWKGPFDAYSPGLDTYFFLNLAVGQPSNNMDLSEIEICLGMIMIFSFGICIVRKENKISGRTYTCFCCCFFHFRIYCAWSTLSHDKPSVFLSRSSVVYFHHPFLRQLPGVYFK